MSALPVSATPELYFGEVTTLEDGSKMVSLIVKDVKNLGSCDANIGFSTSEGVEVTGVTSGDGNAITVQTVDINNTAGLVQVTAWDASTSYSGEVVLCKIEYKDEGSDSNPFEKPIVELYDYNSYEQIKHTGNNDIERSSDISATDPTVTNTTGDPATNAATVSGEDNNGIPGFGLLAGLSVMLITVRLLRDDK